MDLRDILKSLAGGGERRWTKGTGDNFSDGHDGYGYGREEGPSTRLPRAHRIFLTLALSLFLFFMGFGWFAVFYTDLLWFESQGLGSVLWSRFFYQAAMFVAAAGLSFAAYASNWVRALSSGIREYRSVTGEPEPAWMRVPLVWAAAGVLALINGFANMSGWSVAMQFLRRAPFGETDAIFGIDIGFFVFSLPFMKLAVRWLIGVSAICLVGALAAYLMTGSLRYERGKIASASGTELHLAALASVCVFLFGCGLWLSRYELLISPSGIVHGMGYVDRYVRLPALSAMSLAVLASSPAVALAGLLKLGPRRWRALMAVAGGVIAAGILVQALLPPIVQKYVVKPNEYEREKRFIDHHIKATRRAFSIDGVKTFQMTPAPEVRPFEMLTESDTVSNIRLWDYAPLLRTYKQLQEIRTYYDFGDADIDRYDIGGRNRQVMLSVRELDVSQLQSRTWVNVHLEFTHGYGVVMNPVNEMEEGGLPVFFMKDLPPKSTVPISIERPQIYYGEKPETYALVKTDVNEFDYPMGDSNVRSSYEGSGGAEIGSLFRRLLYAARFRDSEIFFTGSLRPDSRILYNRNIKEAVRTAAPYLILEDDAYPVISGGRIIWIQDAYTATSLYPYSRPLSGPGAVRAGLEPYIGANYLRNSVKITVDAYDGIMNFYIADESDPIIRSWAGIFPAQFKPLEGAPLDMRAHFRYPEEFFEAQSEMYRVYHMTDTNTYYNREDVWMTTPQGQERRIRPNYVTMQLLDEEAPEFVIIAPFMPYGRNNLIGWMAGRSDGERNGELVAYQFPKQELVFGPSQIEALIDQNTEISSQLSLWSQRGSDVIRGDLLVIPIGKSLLYVQPLYLRAERGDLPELKRVILSTGGRVAWGETFDAAAASLFGDVPAASELGAGGELQPSASANSGGALRDLAESARMHYDAAIKASQSGDWARYGDELGKLGEALEELARAAGGFGRGGAVTSPGAAQEGGEAYDDGSNL